MLIRSDSMSVVSYINHQGALSLNRLCLLAERLLEWAQPHLRSLRAAHIPGKLNQGADKLSRSNFPSEECAPSADCSENLGELWQGRGRPLCLRRQLSLPDLLFEGRGCFGPRMAQPPPLCVHPDRPDSAGYQANQGAGTQGPLGGPPVEESTLVVRADSAAHSSSVAHSSETGPPVSRERDNFGPICGPCTFGRSTGARELLGEHAEYHF